MRASVVRSGRHGQIPDPLDEARHEADRRLDVGRVAGLDAGVARSGSGSRRSPRSPRRPRAGSLRVSVPPRLATWNWWGMLRARSAISHQQIDQGRRADGAGVHHPDRAVPQAQARRWARRRACRGRRRPGRCRWPGRPAGGDRARPPRARRAGRPPPARWPRRRCTSAVVGPGGAAAPRSSRRRRRGRRGSCRSRGRPSAASSRVRVDDVARAHQLAHALGAAARRRSRGPPASGRLRALLLIEQVDRGRADDPVQRPPGPCTTHPLPDEGPGVPAADRGEDLYVASARRCG